MGADYDYEIIEDVIVIYDLDLGGRSVTNDIENVLQEIGRNIGGIGDRKVIYRDSGKVFDGVLHSDGRFQNFYPINETVLENAINKVNS